MDFHYFLAYRRWNGFVMLFEAFEISLYRIGDVAYCLCPRFALGNASGQCRAFRNEHTVLVLLNNDAEFHRHL